MLFVVVLLGLLSVASAGNAWFTQFKPGTEYWVSPNATLGAGACSKTEPCSFSHAAREEQKGDGVIYWLLPGNYTSGTKHFFSPTWTFADFFTSQRREPSLLSVTVN